ncbi:unnamed protein product [Anisakis simplex]|uniref:PDZ domain-containing protein n=1 Tax=Anisakis simplex TaxID=6269 RepID=A0A0M3JV93_ANISI|nr:unnamed protein product [Anisakis simplex]
MVAETTVRVNIDIGELPGIHFNNDLIVTFVQRSGALDGKIKIGDKILNVNEHPVEDRNTLERILLKHHIHRITVIRDAAREEQIIQEQQVPNDKNIARRDGFIYLLLTMEQRKTAVRLGLTVKNGEPGSVYVSKILNGSLAAEKLQVGDRILELDGNVISEKEAAKKAFLKALTSPSGSISIIVERADSAVARGIVADALVPDSPHSNREKAN